MVLACSAAASAQLAEEVASTPVVEDVFVRDSAAAIDRLALAVRMERLREWTTSAQVYQELIEQHGETLLPALLDERSRPLIYRSVTQEVQRRLSAWPAEGLEVYRTLYAVRAAGELEAAGGNDSALARVLDQYFPTDAGLEAGVVLLERAYARGEFANAAMLGDRLLAHPSLGERRALLRARTAATWALAGSPERAQSHARQLAAEAPDAQDMVGGEVQNLARWLEATLPTLGPVRDHIETNWPTAFGSAARDAISSDSLEPDSTQAIQVARLFVAPATRPAPAATSADANFPGTYIATPGIFPVVEGNELFFQDNNAIYAWDLSTGQPLTRWLAERPATGDGAMRLGSGETPRSTPLTVTLTPDAVLGVLGQVDPMAGAPNRVASASASLVSVNRVDGTLRWRFNTSDLTEGDETLRFTAPVGTPMDAGDAVLIVTRGGRTRQFDDTFLVCLDADDGSLRWSRHLVSGNGAGSLFEMTGLPSASVGSQPALADGRVFVTTDLGAVAAIDTLDGSIAWLSVYPRPRPTGSRFVRRGFADAQRPAASHATNPTIVAHGRVLCIPGDSQRLFVFDAIDGTRIQDLDLSRIDARGSGWMLIGALDSRVILASETQVVDVDLDRIRPEGDVRDAIRWRHQVVRRDGGVAIPGRPFLTDRRVYIPTGSGLRAVDHSSGKLVAEYPSRSLARDRSVWPGDEWPGNPVVIGSTIVLGGVDAVAVYLDIPLLRRRLEADIAASPDAVAPRLRAASTFWAMRESTQAVEQLDEAIRLAALASDEVSRQGELAPIAPMLQSLIRESLGRAPVDLTLVRALFDRYERVASDAPTLAASRLTRARFELDQEPAQAVGILRSLLEDRSLASLALRTTDGAERDIAHVAHRMIAQIIARHGREHLDAVEKDAIARLDALRTSPDLESIQAIARAHPWLIESHDAMLRVIDQLEAQGKTDQARASAREALKMVQSRPLAGSLERLGRLSANDPVPHLAAEAASRLLSADPTWVADQPWAGLTGDGRAILASLERRELEAGNAMLPSGDLSKLDLSKPIVTPLEGMVGLLQPRGRGIDAVVGVDRGRRLVIVRPDGRVDRLRTSAAVAGARAQWVDGRLLLVGAEAVALIDPASLEVVWESSLESLANELDDRAMLNDDGVIVSALVTAAPRRAAPRDRNERLAAQRAQVMGQQGRTAGNTIDIDRTVVTPSHVIISSGRGAVFSLKLADGLTSWARTVGERQSTASGSGGGFVAFAYAGDLPRVVVLDELTGRIVLSETFGSTLTNRLGALAMSPRGSMVLLAGDRMIAYDLLTDEPVRRFETSLPGLNFAAMNMNRAESLSMLSIVRDRVYLLWAGTGDGQQVAVYDLRTGAAVEADAPVRFLTPQADGAAGNGVARIRAVGSMLYAWSARGVLAFDADDVGRRVWSRPVEVDDTRSIGIEPVWTRHHLVVFVRSAVAPGEPSRQPAVELFSRRRTPGGVESGRLDRVIDLSFAGAVAGTPVVFETGLGWLRPDGHVVIVAEPVPAP
jgi:outer membrane protein assembly factor BamB